MKKIIITAMSLSLVLLLFSCGSDNSVTESGGTTAKSYYPGGVGTSYTYNGQLNESGQSIPTERKANFVSTQTADGKTYVVQENSTTAGGQVIDGSLLFRGDDGGVYVYINANMINEMLDSIGVDKNTISLSVDPEIKLLEAPLDNGKTWDAFKISVSSYNSIPFNPAISVLTLQGHILGDESVNVPADNETKTAKKVLYTVNIGLPTALAALIKDFPSISASATVWYVKDIGIVKTEGDTFILRTFGGGGFNIGDSTSTMTESLSSYTIK